MNIIVIDTETGGLDHRKHSLLSVGLVFIKNGKLYSQMEIPIKHDIYNVTPGALEVNKIDIVEHDKIAKPIDIVAKELKETIMNIYSDTEKPSFLGHNLMFDLNFIYEQLISKEEMDKIASYRVIDTAVIGRYLNDIGKVKFESYSLTKMLKTLGVDVSDSPQRHSALFDAMITFDLYKSFLEIGGNDD